MYYAIDTETAIIEPGLLAPPLVCLSYASDNGVGLVGRDEAPGMIRAWASRGATFVGHNIAYDFAVLCAHDESLVDLVFRLYLTDRVRDTQIRESLASIAKGTFTADRNKMSLAKLSAKYLDRSLDKSDDGWRMRYAELIDMPIDTWPQAAQDYATEDARATLDVWLAQQASDYTPPDEWLQVPAAFALHLMSVWGVRTEPALVDALEAELAGDKRQLEEALVAAGLMRLTGSKKAIAEGRGKLTRNTKAIKARVVEAFGGSPPLTEKGATKIDRETLAGTDDPDLAAVAELGAIDKLALTFVPVLRRGTEVPINARFNTLVESGRTSCSGPNLQNLPRKGGVRDAFIPRPGWVYVSCDYDTAELRSLAQITYSWFGASEMREAFRRDIDPHLDLAATLIGHDYDTAAHLLEMKNGQVKDARQFAKIGNFGFPGGLGTAAFCRYAKGYGYDTDEERAGVLRDAWFRKWPEMRPYFARISELTDELSPQRIEQYGSGRIRGGVSFTQGANGMFQGLTADYAKHALWEVCVSCYARESSALFGCRPVVFVHDEIIIEAPEARAPEAGEMLAKTMIEQAQAWLPDVPVKASPAIMRRWLKDADTRRGPDGRLLVWEAA